MMTANEMDMLTAMLTQRGVSAGWTEGAGSVDVRVVAYVPLLTSEQAFNELVSRAKTVAADHTSLFISMNWGVFVLRDRVDLADHMLKHQCDAHALAAAEES